jgi:predicted ATPase
MPSPDQSTPALGIATFGELIRYLRHRVRLTQRELSIAVGYGEAQISRLESGYRPPDLATVAARFVPSLQLEAESELADRLLALAANARGEPLPDWLRAAGAAALAPGPEATPGQHSPFRMHAGSLPRPLTSFVGREQALNDLRGFLAAGPGGPNLVTLVGPGGCGKTRLALHVAHDQAGLYPDGAWWVELAPVSDSAGVLQAAALALGLDGEYAAGSANQLCAALQTRRLLLVLDNAEHIVGAAAMLAAAILQNCPGVRLLVTSRETLSIAGEAVYTVPPLSLPPHPLAGPSPEALGESEAVQLFVARAQAVFPAFELTAANVAAVARVCRQLDGLPLAIELAAARVPMLRVADIAARLHESRALMRSQQRGGPARHQTLWEAMEWSYRLLPDCEASLLRRLSVFAGGWTLEAAAALAVRDAEAGAGGIETLELLAQLVRKSLVVLERQPSSEARYHLLETTRQYAGEKLVEAGGDAAARDAHLRYFVSLAEQAEPALRGHSQVDWLRRLDREHDNLRAALTWAISRQEPETALRLAGALGRFWHVRGFYKEARQWLTAALALPGSLGQPACRPWRAKALLSLGNQAWLGGDVDEAERHLVESVDLYRELDDAAGLSIARHLLGHTALWRGDGATGRTRLEESLALSTAAEDAWGIGLALHCLGHLSDDAGDRATALQLYEQSVAVLSEIGAAWDLTHPLCDLAWQLWLDGEVRRARSLFEDNLNTFRELGGRPGIVLALGYLIDIAAAQGDYAQAQSLADEMVALCTALGVDADLATARVYQGEVAYWQGQLTEAAMHFEAGRRAFAKANDTDQVAWVQAQQARLLAYAGELGPAEALLEASLAVLRPTGNKARLGQAHSALADVARTRGHLNRAAELYRSSLQLANERGAQPALAQPIEGLAKLAQAAGQAERATQLFGAAAALRERLETPVPPIEHADYEAHRAAAQAALGQAAYDAAWRTGGGLSREQTIEAALAKDAWSGPAVPAWPVS